MSSNANSTSTSMDTKRRRVEAPVLRGLALGTAARLRSHLKEHPEELNYSQSLPALKYQERSRHAELWKEWKVQLVDLHLKEGGQIRWAVPNLAAIMKWHIQHNRIFCSALQRAVKAFKMPLQVIVYCDEMVPGNALHPDQRRKLCNWFISILQFDQELSSEHVWLPVATLLSSKMKNIEAGCSQAHRCLMEQALTDCFGIANAGILVQVDNEDVLVMFEVLDPLADELGLKSIYDIKGSSGMKPCVKCVNVFMKEHVHATLRGNVDICCFDKAKLEPMTDEDLWQAHDSLERLKPVLRKTPFEKKETAYGVNFSPRGVLASRVLRDRQHPTKCRFDRMHTFESNGIADLEVDLLVKSLSDTGKYSNQQVMKYCNAGWCWHAAPVKLSFRDGSLKGMASDVLQALPILFHFVNVFLQGWDQAKTESFKALFLVVKQLQHIKFTADCSTSATAKLSELVARHLELFQQAYTSSACIPKHHMAMHLGDQYKADGHYADCFATERHQKLVKAMAESYNDCTPERHEFYVISRVNRAMITEINDQLKATASKTVECQGEPKLCLAAYIAPFLNPPMMLHVLGFFAQMS